MGDEIGGHHVSGHVHTTAELREVLNTDANNRKLTFEARSSSPCSLHERACV